MQIGARYIRQRIRKSLPATYACKFRGTSYHRCDLSCISFPILWIDFSLLSSCLLTCLFICFMTTNLYIFAPTKEKHSRMTSIVCANFHYVDRYVYLIFILLILLFAISLSLLDWPHAKGKYLFVYKEYTD